MTLYKGVSMGMDDTDLKTMDYRLTNIEKTVEEIRTGMNALLDQTNKSQTVQKLHERDISDLRIALSEIKTMIEKKDFANEQRIGMIENSIKDLQQRPFKDKAERFQWIVDYIYKGAVAFALLSAASKLHIGG